MTLRDAITGSRSNWDEDHERRQFHDQLRLDATWVISRGADDVGFFTCNVEGHRLLLGTLCVLPAYQCQGVGAEVMGEIILEAKSQCHALELYVLKANPRARAFYERLGFVVIGESQHHHQMHYAVESFAA